MRSYSEAQITEDRNYEDNSCVACCYSLYIITDATTVINEEVYSPVVSYLLAKLQQLELNMMARTNSYLPTGTTGQLSGALEKQQQSLNQLSHVPPLSANVHLVL